MFSNKMAYRIFILISIFCIGCLALSFVSATEGDFIHPLKYEETSDRTFHNGNRNLVILPISSTSEDTVQEYMEYDDLTNENNVYSSIDYEDNVIYYFEVVEKGDNLYLIVIYEHHDNIKDEYHDYKQTQDTDADLKDFNQLNHVTPKVI